MNTSELLLEFSSKSGVSGLIEAQDFAVEILNKYGKTEITPLGSIVCTVKEPKDGEMHLLLDAHIDEIGLIVTHIEDNGFLGIGQIGGNDPRVLPASRVIVHANSKELNGVVCSVPPHLSGNDSKENLSVDKTFIDVGLSGEEAKELIAPGDRITYYSYPGELLGGNVTNKSLDDRAGCVSLIKALDYLDGDIPFGLTVMFSTMEEIGGQGARTAGFSINPTHAISVDVSFAKVPTSPHAKCGELGKGPMIGFAPILSDNISRELVDIAVRNEIPTSMR